MSRSSHSRRHGPTDHEDGEIDDSPAGPSSRPHVERPTNVWSNPFERSPSPSSRVGVKPAKAVRVSSWSPDKPSIPLPAKPISSAVPPVRTRSREREKRDDRGTDERESKSSRESRHGRDEKEARHAGEGRNRTDDKQLREGRDVHDGKKFRESHYSPPLSAARSNASTSEYEPLLRSGPSSKPPRFDVEEDRPRSPARYRRRNEEYGDRRHTERIYDERDLHEADEHRPRRYEWEREDTYRIQGRTGDGRDDRYEREERRARDDRYERESRYDREERYERDDRYERGWEPDEWRDDRPRGGRRREDSWRQDSYRPADDQRDRRRGKSPPRSPKGYRAPPPPPPTTPPLQVEEGEVEEDEDRPATPSAPPPSAPPPEPEEILNPYKPKMIKNRPTRKNTSESFPRASSNAPPPPPDEQPPTPPPPAFSPPPPPDAPNGPSKPVHRALEATRSLGRLEPQFNPGSGLPPVPPAPDRNAINPSTRVSTPVAKHGAMRTEHTPKAFKRWTTEEETVHLRKTFIGTTTLESYDLGSKLGEGTFGVVTKATEKVSKQLVALKKLITHNPRDGVSVTTIREIKILKSLSHPNVVPIRDMVVERDLPNDRSDRGRVFMVFPYMDHDLCGLLCNQDFKMTHSLAKLLFKQILEGIAYIHANNFLHRDLKTANILVDRRGAVMIADFGLARAWTEDAEMPKHLATEYTNMVVTRWYRAPELLLGEVHYGPAVDMWSLGCVLGEMYSRLPILAGESDRDQLFKIFSRCGPLNEQSFPGWDALPGFPDFKGHPWDSVPLETPLVELAQKWHMESTGADLMIKLLTLDPKKRIPADEALDHIWFFSSPRPASLADGLIKVESSHEMTTRQRNEPPGPSHAPFAQGRQPPPYRSGPGQPGPGPAYSNGNLNMNGRGGPHAYSGNLPSVMPPGYPALPNYPAASQSLMPHPNLRPVHGPPGSYNGPNGAPGSYNGPNMAGPLSSLPVRPGQDGIPNGPRVPPPPFALTGGSGGGGGFPPPPPPFGLSAPRGNYGGPPQRAGYGTEMPMGNGGGYVNGMNRGAGFGTGMSHGGPAGMRNGPIVNVMAGPRAPIGHGVNGHGGQGWHGHGAGAGEVGMKRGPMPDAMAAGREKRPRTEGVGGADVILHYDGEG